VGPAHPHRGKRQVSHLPYLSRPVRVLTPARRVVGEGRLELHRPAAVERAAAANQLWTIVLG